MYFLSFRQFAGKQQANSEINRLVNNVLQQLGPAVLGAALNMDSSLPRRPLRPEDIADDDERLFDNSRVSELPKNIVLFEPDEDFSKN